MERQFQVTRAGMLAGKDRVPGERIPASELAHVPEHVVRAILADGILTEVREDGEESGPSPLDRRIEELEEVVGTLSTSLAQMTSKVNAATDRMRALEEKLAALPQAAEPKQRGRRAAAKPQQED